MIWMEVLCIYVKAKSSLSIFSLMVKGVEIDDTRNVDVTFPTFFTLLESVKKEWNNA